MKSPLRLRRVDEPLATALSTSDQRTVARWAADCAEHVLPLFERSRPDDDRPRQAIEAARAGERDWQSTHLTEM